MKRLLLLVAFSLRAAMAMAPATLGARREAEPLTARSGRGGGTGRTTPHATVPVVLAVPGVALTGASAAIERRRA